MGLLELGRQLRCPHSNDLNAWDAYIRARCASSFTFAGEAKRSLTLLDEVEILDPFLPVWRIEAAALVAFDRADKARRMVRKASNAISSRLDHQAAFLRRTLRFLDHRRHSCSLIGPAFGLPAILVV
ncbi:hypothetical protein [Mesorhizobium sp. DCY119]|uniref:hypothetical protein n=1 Tax=Mesorhizobium sp. DCY119 TaxID=2108445 RepID=UPI000E727D8A|nr:hypothetical protein [Mesorhizobium sp. DCY119]RJG40686.1 hypothetical protein D3Y55_25895 [Mesorhizobium sp. DCY119]